MVKEVGWIREIYRYPVKSMAGEKLDTAELGWHGLEGDRRAAFVRSGVRSGVPWLTASKLPALLTYVPLRDPAAAPNALPARVRTPTGQELELGGQTLCAELEAAYGAPVALMEWNHGIFDDAAISLITTATIAAIADAAGLSLDVRRFRPNFLVESNGSGPFGDDAWLGRTIRIGAGEDAAAVAITMRDLRCVMINLDPWTAAAEPRILKAATRLNGTCAGVYATVVKAGPIAVGDRLYLQ